MPRCATRALRKAPAASPRRTRRFWGIALALGAVAIAGAAVAAAGGLLELRDPGPNDLTFPKQITCRQGTTLCTAGRSPDGQAFTLFQIGEAAKDAHVVGAGADTGDGTHATPLVCTRPGNDIQCGSQPPAGEKQFGLYLPD